MACSPKPVSSPEGNRDAVLYARVSSKEQEREGYSIEAQLKLLKDYASNKGIHIIQEFVDIETAKIAGRKNFNEMVQFLKQQGKKAPQSVCRIILVEKTDRLYRNPHDWLAIGEMDMEIHFVKENLVISKDSRSMEKFVHGMMVLMAKNYVDNLSEETKKGMLEKAEQGIYPSAAPLGYINAICDSRRFIQQDTALAPLVNRLFELYATGRYSLIQVTQKLFDEGFVYRKSGGKIQKSHIYQILTNPIYYGDFRWNDKLYSGTHAPIISKELWDQVQAVLQENGKRNTKQQKHDWVFRGLLHCGHCGCAMVAERKKGKYVYYHCTGNKGPCSEKYVREEEVAKQFAEGLKAIQLDGQLLDWVVTALKASHADEKRHHTEMITELQREHQKLQKRLDSIYDDKLDGNITQEFYNEKTVNWRREQKDILKKIESHQNADENYIEEGVRILELANRAYDLYQHQPLENTRTLLDYVYSNSIWMDGKLIANYRKPFDLIVEIRQMQDDMGVETGVNFDKNAENENWLPDKDSNLEHHAPEACALPIELSGNVIKLYHNCF